MVPPSRPDEPTVDSSERPAEPAGEDRLNAPADQEPPLRADLPAVAGYELLDELGRGGMGVVYRARQVRANRTVALKMILAGGYAGEAELARFRTEAEAIGRLQHPNIVQVFEVSEHEGRPFFSLEFCPGGSLARRLDGRPLPAAEAARLVETLARAMQVAHQAQVIHRDLKPANVLLAADGTPKITDFGLAKKLDEGGATVTGAVMGTPSYMAPEQAGGQKDVGPPADLYALGAILYEALTTRPPFQAATPLDTLMQVVADDPVPPRRLNAQVPADLETVCLKCLHKEPSKRYASAAALAEDLRRFQAGEPITARPVGKAERLWRWCRRKPLLAGSAAALAVALVTVVVLAILAARNAQAVAAAEKDLAAAEKDNARKDRQRLRESLLEQARAERLAGNRFRALELIREASKGGSSEHLRQEAIQAITSPGARFVQEVEVDWNGFRYDRDHFPQLPEYGFRFPQSPTWLARGADGGAELLVAGKRLLVLPPHLGLPQKCCLSPDSRWLAFRDATEPNLIRIWDCRQGQLQGRLPAVGDLAMVGMTFGLLSGIAFSPDGVLLASTHARGGEGVLLVNETVSRLTLMTRNGLVASGWSKDGKFLLALSRTSATGPQPRGSSGPNTSDPGVNLDVALAQVWEVSCPVPTYQIREAVEQLRFRVDGRQLIVNDTVWDVEPGNDRVALQETALATRRCVLGFRGTDVWGVSRPEGQPDRNRVLQRTGYDQHWQTELGALMVARLAAVVPGPGTLPGLGYLFADFGPIRWGRPRVVGPRPAIREIVLAPPTNPLLGPLLSWHGDQPRISFLRPRRMAWSRDGTKVLAIVQAGSLWVDRDPRFLSGGFSNLNPSHRLVGAWDIPSGNRYPLRLPIAEWRDVAWHPGGHRFAAAGGHGVKVWDLATSAELVTLSRTDTDQVVWSDDGQHLLAVKKDKQAVI
jgi:hypothetical protein